MGFSISNLTIFAMTIIVVFCNTDELDWTKLAVFTVPEKFGDRQEPKVCIDDLERAGFDITTNRGFKNLVDKVPGLYEKPRTSRIDLEAYKDFAKEKINNNTIRPKNNRAVAYYFGLAIHFLDPENMMPVTTWCEIHGNGTYDAHEFPPKYDNTYKQYLRRIANSTGLSKKKQTLVYRTIDVCYRDITNESKGLFNSSYFYAKYKSDIENNKADFKPNPLNWCAINACFESLRNAGFSDVSAKQNIKDVMPTLKIKETYGYIYEFHQYLRNVSKRPTDDNQTVNPHDSKIGIQIGYLRNWCSAQVCHADLLEKGYVNEHATDNINYVLPSIKKKMSAYGHAITKSLDTSNEKGGQILSKFVEDFSEYLVFIKHTMHSTFNLYESRQYDIPANGSPKSPLDWCKFTVVPYKSYYVYDSPKL